MPRLRMLQLKVLGIVSEVLVWRRTGKGISVAIFLEVLLVQPFELVLPPTSREECAIWKEPKMMPSLCKVIVKVRKKFYGMGNPFTIKNPVLKTQISRDQRIPRSGEDDCTSDFASAC